MTTSAPAPVNSAKHSRPELRSAVRTIDLNGRTRSHDHMPRPSSIETADVVIAGGGFAALNVAFRLKQADSGLKVVVLERKPSVGGRIDTSFVDVNGMQVKFEEGGMRFLKSHALLNRLIDELGLRPEVMPFHMGDEQNLFYLNRHRFTRGEVKVDPGLWSKAYNLRDDEIGCGPIDLLSRALNKIIDANGASGFSPSTPEDWQRVRNQFIWDGQPLNRWSFWGLLDDLGLSAPATNLIFNAGGFHAPGDLKANAGAAFQLFGNFPDTPTFQTLRPGYQALAMKLVESASCGGSVHFRTSSKLESFKEESGVFNLTVRNGAGFDQKIECRAIVLAMPTMGLDELCRTSPPLRRHRCFQADLGSVETMKLMKINLTFEERFWFTKLGIIAGGNFTDLPLGQVYVFEPHAAGLENGPAAMTVYCDSGRSEFWSGLQSRGSAFFSPICPDLPPGSTAASEAVVKACRQQLAELFDLPIPEPVVATIKAWGHHGVGDGDHLWAVGYDDSVVGPRIREPLPGVYVAGECFSDEQCWVEGALRSSDQVADGVIQYLGL